MKYDRLYIRILEIGRDNLNEGVSFEDLKKQLTKEGCDFENGCIDKAVKRWFFDSFEHVIDQEDGTHKVIENYSDLPEHLGCQFIMKGNRCLALVEHEKSKRNIWVAAIAAGIAFATLAYQIWQDTKSQSKEPTGYTTTESQQYHYNTNDSECDCRCEQW